MSEQTFEDRPEVAEALLDDTTVTGLPVDADAAPDPDTPKFQEPGEPG